MDNSAKRLKFISTGGAGDALIVYLKLRQLLDNRCYRLKSKNIIWLHVESNDLIKKVCEDFFGPDIEFECDPDYIRNYQKGKWNDYVPVSSGIDTLCPLKGHTKLELKNPFLFESEESYRNNSIVLQCSAGAKNNRGWKINPLFLKVAIEQKTGNPVILVGNDKRFADASDPNNLVGKQSIVEVCEYIQRSQMFIGLSGFLNYYACATRTKNIHLIESKEHDKRYYHELWVPYTKGIKIGSGQEILVNLK